MGNKISTIAIIVLVIICAALLFQKGDSHRGNSFVIEPENEESASIHVAAFESKNFVANEYLLDFAVELYGKDKEKLFKEMEVRQNQIFAAAKQVGISAENVEQNSLKIEKPWNFEKSKKFLAVQKFKVSVSKKEEADSLSDLLSTISDVEIHQTKSTLKNGDSLQAEVVKKACRKALFKADRYAESVGEKAGKVLLVNGDVETSKYNMADSVSINANVFLSMAIANSEESDAKALLTVTSSESQKYIADEFLSSFSIEFVDADKEALYKKIDKRSAEVISRILSLGVPQKNVSAERISLTKEWNFEQGERKFVGYKALQNINVKSDSKELATALVDLLAPDSDVQCNGTTPLLKNQELREARVIQKTGEMALAKANLFASALDLKVGKTQKLTDESEFYRTTVLGARRGKYNDGILLSAGSSQNVIADSVEVKASLVLTVELE